MTGGNGLALPTRDRLPYLTSDPGLRVVVVWLVAALVVAGTATRRAEITG